MLRFLHQSEHEFRQLIPKGDLLLLQNGLWEFVCEFRPVINSKMQAYIKSIGNHAKKSYSA